MIWILRGQLAYIAMFPAAGLLAWALGPVHRWAAARWTNTHTHTHTHRKTKGD